MRIESGVQFLFAKVPICKGFHIPFNESRLCGGPVCGYSETSAIELVPFLPMYFLIIGLEGVH